MKPIFEKIREDFRRSLKNFFIFWAAGAIIIFIGFIILLLWPGSSIGSRGYGKAVLQIIAIAIVVPPAVWFIGKMKI